MSNKEDIRKASLRFLPTFRRERVALRSKKNERMTLSLLVLKSSGEEFFVGFFIPSVGKMTLSSPVMLGEPKIRRSAEGQLTSYEL